MRLIVRLGLTLCGGMILVLTLAAAVARQDVRTPPAAWIAFVHDDGATAILYRARVVGGVPQRIAGGRAMSTPTWSPDGVWLAYSAARDDGDHFALYRVRSDGSGQQRITPPDRDAATPDWSPDGDWLVYVEWSHNAPLYRIRPDGTDRERLTTGAGEDNFRTPVWSPNGAWIAYTRITSDTYASIEIMRADGNDPQVVIPTSLISLAPAWSPDSRWIAFQSNRDAMQWRIYRVPFVGGDPLPVSPPGGQAETPDWSPDGAWIIFALAAPPSNNLYRVHPDGTDVEQIVDFPRSMRSPAWGPPVAVPFRPGLAFGVGSACLAAAYRLRPRSSITA